MASSFIIVEVASGKAILETWDLRVVSMINTEKYKAMPVREYLQAFNKQLKK